MLKIIFTLFTLFIFYHINAQVILQNFPRPCGIYALGTLTGGANDIRDYPFVDGFVMRTDWTSIETAEDVYNFTTLEKVVRKLDTLNQGLTLDIFRMKVPPYIINTPGTETYTLTVGPQTFTTAVPWDVLANTRFTKLMDTVANHPIWSISNNAAVPLKDHPVLKQIDASPIGMNGLRDLFNQLLPLPNYQRNKFVKAIVGTANTVVTKFPKQFAFMAIFGLNDNIPNPTLSNYLRDSLMNAFNRNGIPKLGFFQENLACSTPAGTNTNSLFLKRDSTFTMNQMLQGWQNPFLNPARTDPCISPTGGPDIGILYGLNTFKSTYCEIYNVDLDYPDYWAAFESVHDTLEKYCSGTALPVSIISFKGKRKEHINYLKWISSDTKEVLLYEVQRLHASTQQYETIATIETDKSCLSTCQFEYEDHLESRLLMENNYYRIKIYSRDGLVTYSDAMVVHPDISDPASVKFFPNPVTGNQAWTVESIEETIEALALLNPEGQLIYEIKDIQNHQYILQHASLPEGLYILKVMTESGEVYYLRGTKQ